MKILLSILLLFSFAANAQDTTKYMAMSAKGYKFNGGTFKNIWIGQDTTNYKTGIVRIGFRFFVGNGVYWKEIAGGSSAPSGLTGAVVTQIDSTRFNVSPGSYYIQGSLYASGDTTFNLAQPGDTSRIDVIGLDTLGQVFTITGVESENPYPSSIDPLSQIYLSFVWVDTDTVYFAPTPVNYWSALGNDIIPNNPGKVQFKNGLYVDQITANDSRLFTGKQLILQSNRPTGSKIFAGISGGNTALNTTELQLSLGDNSTTGTAKTGLSLTGRSLHASGTEDMNMISITPSIVQSGSYSGSVRGIYYNPTVTSNVGTHYAFESTLGRIRFGGLETGDTTTYNYFVISDVNGNIRKVPVFSGGGGGGVGTLQQTLTEGSTLTTDNIINANNTQLFIDSVLKYKVTTKVDGANYSEMQIAAAEAYITAENATKGMILNIRPSMFYIDNTIGGTTYLQFKNLPSITEPRFGLGVGLNDTVFRYNASTTEEITQQLSDSLSIMRDSLQVLRDSLAAYRAQDTVFTTSGIETVYGDDSTTIRLPYKSYVAIFDYSVGGTLTITVLQNDLGGTVVWTNPGDGEFIGTLANAFTLDKTVFNNSLVDDKTDASTGYPLLNDGGIIGYVRTVSDDDDYVKILTVDAGGIFTDLSLRHFFVTIHVYY